MNNCFKCLFQKFCLLIIHLFYFCNILFIQLSCFICFPGILIEIITNPCRAVCNLVVSPPISTVIPMILLAMADTSFRKNGHKNKVVIRERDAWSDLANFIGKWLQSTKYADAMELNQLPNPDCEVLPRPPKLNCIPVLHPVLNDKSGIKIGRAHV